MHLQSTKPNHRFCTRCLIEKPFSDFEKCASKGFKYGIRPDCKLCRVVIKKEIYLKTPEKQRLYRRNHYLKNRENIISRTSNYSKNHPELRRKISLKHQYGISDVFYENMKIFQGGKCAICLTEPKNHVLFVDHCHKTGKVRGLLCRKCNAVLGMCNDSIEILDSAKKYLKENMEIIYGISK